MNEFTKVLDQAVKKIKKDKVVMEQIELIALLGSVAEKEAIANYSDLDILIILKSNKLGSFKKEIIEKLKKIVADLSSNCSIKISFLTHTIDDFKNYVDLEYLTHYSWGEVVFTKNKSLKHEIKKICQKINGDFNEKIQKLMVYNLRHARFNILREYISLNQYNINNYKRVFGRKIIDKVFEISDWALIYSGIWSNNKKEIVQNIESKYGLVLNTKILDKAYNLRKQWNQLTDKELSRFFPEAIDFMIDIIEIIIKEDLKK